MSYFNHIKTIENISKPKVAGPLSIFKPVHVVEAINQIGEHPIGRIKLAKKISLGEGAIRTLLKHLKNNGLIEIDSKLGCKLTKEGKKIFKFIRSTTTNTIDIPKISIALGDYNVGLLVRKSSEAIKKGVEQRDAAIQAGAVGATTLIFKKGTFLMPGNNKDCLKKMPEARQTIISGLHPENGDVVIIGSGKTKISAEISVKAAAFETLKQYYD